MICRTLVDTRYKSGKTNYNMAESEGRVYKPVILPGVLDFRANIEAIERLESKIEKLEQRITGMESGIQDNMQRLLTEEKFLRELQSGEEIVEKIVQRLGHLQPIVSTSMPTLDFEERPVGKVEMIKAQAITDLLTEHRKVSSTQLSQLMSISRTRANEYLRMLENSGVVKGEQMGREKVYYLKL